MMSLYLAGPCLRAYLPKRGHLLSGRTARRGPPPGVLDPHGPAAGPGGRGKGPLAVRSSPRVDRYVRRVLRAALLPAAQPPDRRPGAVPHRRARLGAQEGGAGPPRDLAADRLPGEIPNRD